LSTLERFEGGHPKIPTTTPQNRALYCLFDGPGTGDTLAFHDAVSADGPV